MKSQIGTFVCFYGGRSLGARTALRRSDSFEDLKETTITVIIISRSAILNYK